MWQRFTERSRKVIFNALEEAVASNEIEVSPMHLLMGLVREEDSVAGRVLMQMQIEPSSLRVAVEPQVWPPPPRQAVMTEAVIQRDGLQLTRDAKHVIDLAFAEARRLGNKYIGTEHLLLGLIHEGGSLAGCLLSEQGVTLERARQEVMRLQGGNVPPAPGATPKRPWWHFFRP